MMKNADVIITFKEYPHTDPMERAQELFDLCSSAARGIVHPTMATYDLNMINSYRTTTEPMKSFVSRMKAFEGQDGILSVSMSHCFPYGDVADVGAKILVISDDDYQKAETLARQIGEDVWSIREDLSTTHQY